MNLWTPTASRRQISPLAGAGVARGAAQYGDINISLQVSQPNATPQQIAQATHDGVRSALAQRDFTQTALGAGIGQ